MRVAEINRMIEIWQEDKRRFDWIAEGLEFIIGSAEKMQENETTAVFRKNMAEHFPKPTERARALKNMVVAMSNEDPEDYEEDKRAQEADFFLVEMLKAVLEAFDEAETPDDCKAIISKIL